MSTTSDTVQRSGPVYVGRMPAWLVRELDEVARREDRSRAAEIRRALEDHVRRSHTTSREAA